MKRKNPNLPKDGKYYFSAAAKEILLYALCILKVNPMNSINLSREMGSLFHRDPSNSTNSSNSINSSNSNTAEL
jgi:hypothetical protein